MPFIRNIIFGRDEGYLLPRIHIDHHLLPSLTYTMSSLTASQKLLWVAKSNVGLLSLMKGNISLCK